MVQTAERKFTSEAISDYFIQDFEKKIELKVEFTSERVLCSMLTYSTAISRRVCKSMITRPYM